MQEAKQQPVARVSGSELSLRRSQRLVASASTQQLQEAKAKLEQCKAQLNSTTEGEERASLCLLAAVKEVSHVLNVFIFCVSLSEPQKYQQMLEPPAIAKPFTIDVDKKLEEGQKVSKGMYVRVRGFCFVLYLGLYVCPLRNGYFIQKACFCFCFTFIYLCVVMWMPHGFHVGSWDLTFNSECQAWVPSLAKPSHWPPASLSPSSNGCCA